MVAALYRIETGRRVNGDGVSLRLIYWRRLKASYWSVIGFGLLSDDAARMGSADKRRRLPEVSYDGDRQKYRWA